ncbi:hypothetical protein DFQ26_003280 [Actinomortierella ambigua]|nr:hypothetical protein DFQ26_003280 [Actinomortierella ambigua]
MKTKPETISVTTDATILPHGAALDPSTPSSSDASVEEATATNVNGKTERASKPAMPQVSSGITLSNGHDLRTESSRPPHPSPEQPHNNIVIEENGQQHKQQTTSPNPIEIERGGVSRETQDDDDVLAKNSLESQERDSPAMTLTDSINSCHAPLALTRHDQHANNNQHTTTTTTPMHDTNNNSNNSNTNSHNDRTTHTQLPSTATMAANAPTNHHETDETEDLVEEEVVEFQFYMNDGPTSPTTVRTRPVNSELAGDSDDDEDMHTGKSKTRSEPSLAKATGIPTSTADRSPPTTTTKSLTTTPPMSPSSSRLSYRPSTSAHSPDDSRANDIDTSRDMLTKGQAFAYVGLVLVTANTFFQALNSVPESPESARAKESLESFISKLIYSLSKHMDIDADTQKTIAQLPQMMIQPEDLLESFVADGTSRVVSSSQVDQVSITRPASPAMSMTSDGGSLTSLSSSSSSSKISQPWSTVSSETLIEPVPTPGSPLLPPAMPPMASPPPPQPSNEQQQEQQQQQQHPQPPQPETQPPRLSISSHVSTDSSVSDIQRSGSNSPPSMARTSFASTRSVSTLALASSSSFSSSSQGKTSTSSTTTRSITVDLKWTMIADLFLIAIGDSVYDSRARALLKTVGRHLGLEWAEIVEMEQAIMKQLQQQASQSSSNGGGGGDLLKVDTKSRNAETRKRRMIMMGLATVGGGLVLGLSAGLAAPLIGAGIGAILTSAHITGATVTAASAFLTGTGGVAVITSGAAMTGSGLAMKKMARRTAGIDTFEFITVHDNGRANVILTIAGWLDIGDEDATLPFSTLEPSNGDHTALFWEPEMLMTLGSALGLLTSEILTLTAQEILKHTLLGGLLSALTWPMALTRLGYLIDNPWSNALDRAKLAGLVLADCLVMRSFLGFRPVTLVGYSLGARVIFYCLIELARLDAFGIVEDVFLFGAPVTASSTQWRQAQSVVAGDFVNGYLKSDWVLGFLFRATTGGLGTVAGLRPLQNVGDRIRNVDLTGSVDGHMDYRLKIPTLMRKVGNLTVSSDSFLDKEEEILFQRQQKRKNPSEPLRAPKPKMPSKAELENSQTLTEEEKKQLEAAFRRPAPKAQLPDVDSIQGLTDAEKQQLKAALGIVD